MRTASIALFLVAALSCADPSNPNVRAPHGAIAEGISGPLGTPLASLTDAQLERFEAGREFLKRRFSPSEGLGPRYNVTFCGACHEKPVFGGKAGLYRNFFLAGNTTSSRQFEAAPGVGEGGVVRYYVGQSSSELGSVSAMDASIIAERQAISFFGSGLLAELNSSQIRSRADPDDLDGDGISGRFSGGFFGRKGQTRSLAGFVRGPLMNHLGLTTDPLSAESNAKLPRFTNGRDTENAIARAISPSREFQASIPEELLTDDDGVADPEVSDEELLNILTFVMGLAAPEIALTEEGARGEVVFDTLGCDACHTPRLSGPRGPIPVYSDLLIHDMGEALADGLVQGIATGSEFRTQPLWGLAAAGPYLHDGRAGTIAEAISWHGGEGRRSADRFAELGAEDRAALMEFLSCLGGREQHTLGLIDLSAPMPDPGSVGGPLVGLDPSQQASFERGRALFDREFTYEEGAGGPRLNGDSCRACHFEPAIGGAGPLGVNVLRRGLVTEEGEFVTPPEGTILHKLSGLSAPGDLLFAARPIVEQRQTPSILGAGLIDAIAESDILAGADPSDADNDGISGVAAITSDGRVGRFGWKAQVPSIAEFVRDAGSAELGMTFPSSENLTFGAISDNDGVADPEFTGSAARDLEDFMALLAPPPAKSVLTAEEQAGRTLFSSVGCESCHRESFPSSAGVVRLYSDLLLHDVGTAVGVGIPDGNATGAEFRTPPLWGIGSTAPYLHDGRAETLESAILAHQREGAAATDAYVALSPTEKTALIAFLRAF